MVYQIGIRLPASTVLLDEFVEAFSYSAITVLCDLYSALNKTICTNCFNLIRQLISFFLGCNETLTAVNGTFQSPNFPRKYPDGQYCSWRITVNATQQIHLMFTNFSLENENDTDELYVYDGVNATGEVLGVFYGGHPPPKEGIYSSSNRMFLIFKSDKTVSYSGFSASYYVVYKSGMF